MEITNEMVEKIAHLARLRIPEADKETVKNELQQMIEFVDKLNDIYPEASLSNLLAKAVII